MENRKGLAAIASKSPSTAMRFRLARKALGMRQRELAEALSITKQSVSDIERGVNQVSMRVFALLVTKHRISAYWLLEGSGPVMRE